MHSVRFSRYCFNSKFKMISFVIGLSWITVAIGQQLPSSFKRCPAEDLENSACLKTAISDSIVKLSDNGAPELGVERLDPLIIPQIELKQGGTVDVNMQLKNCQLAGLRNLRIESAGGNTSSVENFGIRAIGITPTLVLTGPYTIKGKILILPVNGQGKSNLTMTNVRAEIKIKGSPDIRNGQKFLKINSFKMNIKDVKRIYFNFHGLFNNDKRLSDNTNNFLNQNWEIIYSELKSSITSSFSKVFEDYAKKILESVPYDDIFIAS